MLYCYVAVKGLCAAGAKSGVSMLAGLADERAGSMAVAVVSARLRSALIEAAAAYRQENEFEVLNELVYIAGVLDRFPLPPGSPQADMIATAVQQRATLPERQVGIPHHPAVVSVRPSMCLSVCLPA